MPTDRPTATELLESVAEFIEVKVIPGLDNATAFYSRVALNVLAIVSQSGVMCMCELFIELEHLQLRVPF